MRLAFNGVRKPNSRASIFYFEQQHRDLDRVANFVRRRAIKNIADKPMTVRRHRDKIDPFLTRKLDDSIGWFSECENRFAGKAFVAQLLPTLLPNKRGPVSSRHFPPA